MSAGASPDGPPVGYDLGLRDGPPVTLASLVGQASSSACAAALPPLAAPPMERRPKKNGQRFCVGPFPHGVGQTTPQTTLPTLGGRGHRGWLHSGGRLGWPSHRWNAGPKNWQRFRVGPFHHSFGQTMPRTALPTLGDRWHGGWMRARGEGCRPPLVDPPVQKIASASACFRFIMGLIKQPREWRSRHLRVVGTVVGHLGVTAHFAVGEAGPAIGLVCRLDAAPTGIAGGRCKPLLRVGCRRT